MNKRIIIFVSLLVMIKLIANILLSFLILASSTGVPFFKHYCAKNDIKLTSLIGEVSCDHEPVQTNTCEGQCDHNPVSSHDEGLEDNCCVDYADIVKIDLNLLKSGKLKISKPVLTHVASSLDYKLDIALFKNNFTNQINAPPLLYNKDILTSCCTFLL